MTDTALGRAALVSLALGTATIGCTPSARMGHVAALSDRAAKGGAIAAHAADRARAALVRHDAEGAVRLAEQAVAASPNDADHRMLLGQAYLAAGRFASAEASLRDSLALLPDQPRAGFDLALAQIAQGMPAEARVTLAGVKGRVPDTDLGLALALAGDRPNGIAVLTDLIRSGKSDARGRQNLALVFALNGQMGEARGMAMQDTPPDRIEAKLSDWRAMAKQTPGAHQIATMLGVAPALADPGRPTALALAAPTDKAPVALALAPPMPTAPQAIATAMPAPAIVLPLEAPADAPAVAAPVPAPVMVAAASAPRATVPTLLARAQTPPPARDTAMPALVRVAAVAPGPLLHAPAGSGFVVQLGAFARAGALDAAWAQAARLSPHVANLEAVRGSTRHLGGTLVRLSIGGFASRRDAGAVCGQIRARGGACFVRGAVDDRPWQWAKKDTPTQIAMR